MKRLAVKTQVMLGGSATPFAGGLDGCRQCILSRMRLGAKYIRLSNKAAVLPRRIEGGLLSTATFLFSFLFVLEQMPSKPTNRLSSKSVTAKAHFALSDRLHSDNLEQAYGKIRARVIHHSVRMRRAHLVDQYGISRTFALTYYTHPIKDPQVRRVDQEIKAGGLIGKTFRKYGFVVRKNVLAVGVLEAPRWLADAYHETPGKIKFRVSEFIARKQAGSPTVYGTVVEIYPRNFREPMVNAVDRSQLNPTMRAFEQEGISAEEVWDRIGEKNNWKNQELKWKKAKRRSEKIVADLLARISKSLKSPR